MKLNVLIPSHGGWTADFGHSVAMMSAALMAQQPFPDMDFGIVMETSSMLVRSRTDLAKRGLKQGATHLLFLDADMTFPMNLAHRLLRWNVPIVGANYIRKVEPFTPTACGLDGRPVYSGGEHGAEARGLQPVRHLGFGAILIKAEVFAALPEPWFLMPWDEAGGGRYIGEDVYFCHLARREGFDVMVDHDLSREVGHVGPYEFTADMAQKLA